MAKKIRLHNVVEGAGSVVANAFSRVSGYDRLKKRNIADFYNREALGMSALIGLPVGFFVTAAAVISIFPPSMAAALLICGGAAAGPLLGAQLSSIWIAGKHDEKMEMLEEEKKKRLAPPSPKPAEQRLA